MSCRRPLDQAAWEQPAERASPAVPVVVQRDVLGDREVEHEPAALAILGDVAEAVVEVLAAAAPRHVVACERRPCRRSGRAEPRDRVDQLRLAVPVDAGDATISPARTSNETPRTFSMPRSSTDVQIFDRRAAARRRRRAFVDSKENVTTDHQPREAAPRSHPPRRWVSMIFPRRRTVIRSAMSSTSFSLWLMKMIDIPSPMSARRIVEELLGLLRREHGGRLVEDEDLRAAVERLQDLDPLLLADGDVLDRAHRDRPRGRTTCESSRTRALAPRRSRGGPVALGSMPRTMFSATVITGMSMKCWCTMPIPRSIASRGDGTSPAVPLMPDLALVGLVEPVEDVHQRRLAGAVLAEERVHLAAAKVEADVVVGDDPGNALVIPRSSRTGASSSIAAGF